MSEKFGEQILKMAGILDKRNAEDILLIDIRETSVISDYFLICTGKAVNHVKLLSDELDGAMSKENVHYSRIEGYSDGRWIVMDYGDVLVHIFHRDEREFYNIERLWKTDGNWMDYKPEVKDGDTDKACP